MRSASLASSAVFSSNGTASTALRRQGSNGFGPQRRFAAFGRRGQHRIDLCAAQRWRLSRAAACSAPPLPAAIPNSSGDTRCVADSAQRAERRRTDGLVATLRRRQHRRQRHRVVNQIQEGRHGVRRQRR